MATFRFKVHVGSANKSVSYFRVNWFNNISVCTYPKEFESLKVMWGDGKSEYIINGQTKLTRHDYWTYSGKIGVQNSSRKINHTYATTGTKTIALEIKGKCPLLNFFACPVVEILDPLPRMYTEVGIDVQLLFKTFDSVAVSTLPEDVFKNNIYVNQFIDAIARSNNIVKLPKELLTPFELLEDMTGYLYDCKNFEDNGYIRPPNVKCMTAIALGTKAPGGYDLFVDQGSTTWITARRLWEESKASMDSHKTQYTRTFGFNEVRTFPFKPTYKSRDYFMKDGRRFESVFITTKAGEQEFGYTCPDGLDLGAKFYKGTSNEATGYFDKTYKDIGSKMHHSSDLRLSLGYKGADGNLVTEGVGGSKEWGQDEGGDATHWVYYSSYWYSKGLTLFVEGSSTGNIRTYIKAIADVSYDKFHIPGRMKHMIVSNTEEDSTISDIKDGKAYISLEANFGTGSSMWAFRGWAKVWLRAIVYDTVTSQTFVSNPFYVYYPAP